MNSETCRFCGRQRDRRDNGFSHVAFHVSAGGRLEKSARPENPMAAPKATFDRVMNWITGVLLLASITILVFFQTYPPQ